MDTEGPVEILHAGPRLTNLIGAEIEKGLLEQGHSEFVWIAKEDWSVSQDDPLHLVQTGFFCPTS